MKKLFVLLATILLPLMANAHDIEVKNAQGVTIYYNYINDGTELAVTYRGTSYNSYIDEYTGEVIIPEEVTYNSKTLKVTSIGGSAFSGCSGLTSVTFYCKEIGKWFQNGYIKEIIIGDGVTSIEEDAFLNCTKLSSVTISNSVTSIGNGAFRSCNNLKKVIVSDIAKWCDINFGDSHSNPLDYAKHFYSDKYTEIKNLVIPSGVKSINNYAFYGCSGLTSVNIPNSVTSIGGSAFAQCDGLKSVEFHCKNVESWFINAHNINKIVLSDEVENIGNLAFFGFSNLTSITIPNSVISIGKSSFEDCRSLTSLTIPNSVTSIGKYAFRNCENLKTFIIGNSVTSIGDEAFNNCSSLTSVEFHCKNIGRWIIDYHTRQSIKQIVIGDEVVSIENSAFERFTGLVAITIGNSLMSIGKKAFDSCSGLTSFTIPNSVTSIGDYAFHDCDNLNSITIPKSVTSIGNFAFSRCSGFTSINVESGNTTYDSRNNCNAIIETATNTLLNGCKNTVIPNSVTSIGPYAFFNCSGPTSVTIPNSVMSIGYAAFSNCSSLTSVAIPKSVTNIGFSAFDCENLATVVSLIENPFVIYGSSSSYGSFSQNTFMNATLYVPKGTIEKYKATDGWKDFANIVEGTPTGITSITSEKETTNAPIYDLNGRRLTEPQKGINIIGGKKVVVR